MADLHSHLLPAVDDGSKSIQQSLHVLQTMLDQGVRDVCLTPHLTVAELVPERLEPKLAEFDAALRLLRKSAPAQPKLHRGVELMLDGPLHPGMVLDRRISLGGSRYVLVEFQPATRAEAIRGLLLQVMERGLVPLVAHPERYQAATLNEVAHWRDLGAAIQCDATTLVRKKGGRTERARQFAEAQLVDILAADNHGDRRTLTSAFTELHAMGAREQAELLTKTNPHAILDDQFLTPVPPIRFTVHWMQRIRTLLRIGAG